MISTLEPQSLLPRISDKLKDLNILIGTTADEGSKPLMYYLPHFFPNQELESPELSSEDFDMIIKKMFHGFSEGVSVRYYLCSIYLSTNHYFETSLKRTDFLF